MAGFMTTASDLGDDSDFIMESGATSDDVLTLLLAREEEGTYVYHCEQIQTTQSIYLQRKQS